MDKDVFLGALALFLSQWLVHHDHRLTQDAVAERLQKHADTLFSLFCFRHHPDVHDLEKYAALRGRFEADDFVVSLAKEALHSIVKTNFFVKDMPCGFRFDTHFYAFLPQDLRKNVFHQTPFGLFYIVADSYFGFHIRFQDVARGGLRTVLASKRRKSILLECYDLAWTQEKKNKDIAEGGAKGILYVDVPDDAKHDANTEFMYEAQRGYIRSLISLAHTTDAGALCEKNIIDYYGKPEDIYLGPDENMHDSMIEWIWRYSKAQGYKPGSAFITSKSGAGINHKKYGVTSYGVTVYLKKVLEYLGQQAGPFTVKMMGGPDGDVAGNEILNLHKWYQGRVKLVAVTDISGTAVDPSGLDLEALCTLFHESKPICYYPREMLSREGYVLKRGRQASTKMTAGAIEPISDERAQEISDRAVHGIEADIFIPCGGRPNSLDEKSVLHFLNDAGMPTAKAIIEGANVYITQPARHFLEERGVIIIRDSSANKGGVISSSYEVLASLVLTEDEFLMHKEIIAQQILEKIGQFSEQEASLILNIHEKTKRACSLISRDISDRILEITDLILEWLSERKLPNDPQDLLYKPLFAYCLPLLTTSFRDRLLAKVPDNHKKAIIATSVAAQFVYNDSDHLPLSHPLPQEIIADISKLIQQFER